VIPAWFIKKMAASHAEKLVGVAETAEADKPEERPAAGRCC